MRPGVTRSRQLVGVPMSAATTLQTLVGKYPNTAALHDGRVRSSTVRLQFADYFPVHDAFPATVNELAFDVSELAIVTFLQAKAAGVPLTLLPIVMVGRFQHQFLVADAERPQQPEELKGARVGVRAYSVTTGVWLRGLLEDDYGVPGDSVTWVAADRAHVAGYQEPGDVERLPAGQTLEQLLGSGALAAAVLGTPAAKPGERPTTPVIADPTREAAEWYRRNRIVPINHMLVVRDDLVRRSPELVAEVFRMAAEARAASLEDPRLDPGVPGVTAADCLPIGVESLTPGLELISRYAATQRLIPSPIPVDEMFGDVPALLTWRRHVRTHSTVNAEDIRTTRIPINSSSQRSGCPVKESAMSSDAVQLSAAIATYGHTRQLKAKKLPPTGFDLEFVEVEPIIAAFRRMVRDLEFDVCELAPTTYLAAREAGVPITALPVFLMRRFHHGDIVCRPDSGISEPKDLEGRKVGVRAYTVSTGVWARGILQNEYGVDPDSITWVVDDEEHVTTYQPPANVVTTGPGEPIAGLFHDGSIDAALTGPAGIGRSGAPGAGWAIAGAGFDEARKQSQDFYPLFPDARTLEAEWYERTGIYPIHGLVVVKDDVLEQHPDLVSSLMVAFTAAKQPFLQSLRDGVDDAQEFASYSSLREIVGEDPLPYGIEQNEPSINALIDYSVSQHIVAKRPDIEDVFAI